MPPLPKWGGTRHANTCPVDHFLAACIIANQNGSLVRAIESTDRKTVFEDNLLGFLSSDLTNEKLVKKAKDIFMERVYGETNLFGSENERVLQYLKATQFSVYSTAVCEVCGEDAVSSPEDVLFISEIEKENVEEVITKLLQPQNAEITHFCCQKKVRFGTKKFSAAAPWLLPLRPLTPKVLADVSPTILADLPFNVKVKNDEEELEYELRACSFHSTGHFKALIRSPVGGCIYYDGMKQCYFGSFKKGLQQIGEEGCFLESIFYMRKMK
uniref:USP domain-containing protein n=1 Tax=Panagrolaimus sp. JU765 TaxID=591449 RepID=A0AC34QJH8_9BILA